MALMIGALAARHAGQSPPSADTGTSDMGISAN